MRFDDTLETVLASDLSTPYGVQSAWRQLVDLIGRRRVPPDARALAMLRAIHSRVPAAVRAASARGLAFADPPIELVRLFTGEPVTVSGPVLRTARLSTGEWIELLPALPPPARGILRHRRDLDNLVQRALESFGSEDLGLPDAPERKSPSGDVKAAEPEEAKTQDKPEEVVAVPAAELGPKTAWWQRDLENFEARRPASPLAGSDSPDIPGSPPSDDLPNASDRYAATGDSCLVLEPAPAEEARSRPIPPMTQTSSRSSRAAGMAAQTGVPARRVRQQTDLFRFETDVSGMIRWVSGVLRTPIIGLSLDHRHYPDGSRIDGLASSAFRSRVGFIHARLTIGGRSDAAGIWLLSGVPAFDSGSGYFTGYRGVARRLRADEHAAPSRAQSQLDSLRQLVHELRTPANAISGFAEMIKTETLGPVAPGYRASASTIHDEARYLLGAIDDLDLAARIESHSLVLSPDSVPLRLLLTSIADDLADTIRVRGSQLVLPSDDLAVTGDRKAVERLLSHLLATLVSTSTMQERIAIHLSRRNRMVAITFDRPRALTDYPDDSAFGIDLEDSGRGTPLGTGFALRLVRSLARELGGSLLFEPENLTLHLPAGDQPETDKQPVARPS